MSMMRSSKIMSKTTFHNAPSHLSFKLIKRPKNHSHTTSNNYCVLHFTYIYSIKKKLSPFKTRLMMTPVMMMMKMN